MKKLKYILLAMILPAVMFTACSSDGDDDGGNGSITLSNAGDSSQTAYADEENTGSGFTFTAQSTWTATVVEKKQAKAGVANTQGRVSNPSNRHHFFMPKHAANQQKSARVQAPAKTVRASSVSWLKLMLNGKETYSGNAGTHTLSIELEPNYTGKTRTATITIICGNDKITITVTQDGKTEEGEKPENPNPPANDDKLITQIWSEGKYEENGIGVGSWKSVADFEYDSENRVVTVNSSYISDYAGSVGCDEYSYIYTYSGNSVSCQENFANGNNEDTESVNMMLNAEGYIISGTGVNYRKDDSHEYEYTRNSTFAATYANGYLTKLVENAKSISQSAGHTSENEWEGTNEFVWSNNNLTELNYTSVNKSSISGPFNASATYGTELNITNLDLNWIVYYGEWFSCVDEYGFPALGLYGKRSKNLVKKETSDSYDGGDLYIYTYSWVLDADGYPVQVTIERLPRNNGGGMDNGEIEILNIEYNK